MSDWKLAKIRSTDLGGGGAPCLTCYLHLEYYEPGEPGHSSGQGAGGFALDEPRFRYADGTITVGRRPYDPDDPGEFLGRFPIVEGFEHIVGIMRAAGVGRWEELPGTWVWARATQCKVEAICGVEGGRVFELDAPFKREPGGMA